MSPCKKQQQIDASLLLSTACFWKLLIAFTFKCIIYFCIIYTFLFLLNTFNSIFFLGKKNGVSNNLQHRFRTEIEAF